MPAAVNTRRFLCVGVKRQPPFELSIVAFQAAAGADLLHKLDACQAISGCRVEEGGVRIWICGVLAGGRASHLWRDTPPADAGP